MKTHIFIVFAASAISAPAAIFFDDFSSGSVTDEVTGYIGGFYGSPFNFGQWYGRSSGDPPEARIANGVMTVTNTSPDSFRSAVMLFEPSLFTDGAGEYRVTINVTGYVGDINDSGLVRVWSGSGYDLSGSSADAIWVNTQATPFTALGGATASELGSLVIAGTGIHTLQFTYDGTSAVGIFLGATTAGWPFPTVEYGSLELAVVPEPSSAMLGGMALCALLLRRKRR